MEEHKDVVDFTDRHRDGPNSTIVMDHLVSRMYLDESVNFHKRCCPPFIIKIGHVQHSDTMTLKAD